MGGREQGKLPGPKGKREKVGGVGGTPLLETLGDCIPEGLHSTGMHFGSQESRATHFGSAPPLARPHSGGLHSGRQHSGGYTMEGYTFGD